LSTPRSVRAAFKQVLEGAELDVPIYAHMPYEGAEQRSVVLTIVSGINQRPAIGNQFAPTKKGLEEHYRLQVDCYHDDKDEIDKLADAVEQAIMDSQDELEETYGIFNVRKVTDIDAPAPAANLREARVLMDFEFYTHRELA
jgi:hypothetical protein